MAKRKRNPLPSQEELRRVLDYNPETGLLHWKTRTPDMFRATEGRTKEHACAQWNSRFAGKEALCKNWDGYRGGSLNYQYIAAHRVAWKWMTGEEPDIIDHADRNRANNRFANLSNVDEGGNHRNRRLAANNTSGAVGVHYNKRQAKWIAVINIGSFDTLEQASAARRNAQSALGFHENHGLPN